VTEILEIVMEPVPPFTREAVIALLEEPMSTDPKLRLEGDAETDPEVEEVPVAARAIVCGELLDPSLKLSVAVRVPVAVGLK
jgi:hypothetical protein